MDRIEPTYESNRGFVVLGQHYVQLVPQAAASPSDRPSFWDAPPEPSGSR
jgi:hypothetical protein